MKRVHHKIEQNSDEWLALRMGRFTASTFSGLFMGRKTAGFEKTIYTPVHERLTGTSPDSYYGYHLERGHQMEPYLKEAYEIQTFSRVAPGGFWSLGDWIGASPDGLIGDDGILEGKAPSWNTFIKYLLDDELPKEYFWQVHGQLYVTDRAWADFVVYHPDYGLIVRRIERDAEVETQIVAALEDAIERAETILQQIQRRTAA